MPTPHVPLYKVAQLNNDHCVGAAVMLSFLMDLFSMSPKQQFEKAEILLLLQGVGEIDLPPGLLDLVKDVADKNDPEIGSKI